MPECADSIDTLSALEDEVSSAVVSRWLWGRTSQTAGSPGGAPFSPYIISMRCHGLPDRQKVQCGVLVAVMPHTTLRARSLVLAECHRGQGVYTGRAGVAARIETVDPHHDLAGTPASTTTRALT